LVFTTLNKILQGVEILDIEGSTDCEIAGLTYDSRLVNEKDLFFAITGFKVDGHNFIDLAISEGAAAIVQENELPHRNDATFIKVPDSRKAMSRIAANYYSHPSRKLNLVGVTGTDGKTTTCRILHSLMSSSGITGLLGTAGHIILGKELKADRTTPEALDINRMLAELWRGGASSAVMEVSSHAIALHRVDDIEFSLKIFTNLGTDHLDFHSDSEDYYNTKASIFKSTGSRFCSVINMDDNYGVRLASEIPTGVVGYSLMKRNVEVYGEIISSGIDGLRMNVHYDNTIIDIHSPLIGKPNAYNILAAVTAALQFKINHQDIRECIRNFKGVRGRFERIDAGDFNIIIDYAHTPGAIENLLSALRPLTKNQLSIVFGCGGNRDHSKRPLMGAAAESGSDRIYITSDNPRNENPEAIIEDIIQGLENPESAKIISDRKLAIHTVLKESEKGDTVIIAGKGHEDYQEISGEFHHFNDREVVEEWLKGK